MRFLRYYSIFFTVIIILSSSCNSIKNEYVATKGNLDLSDWNFETHGIVELNGEWSFHWEELFSPEAFPQKAINQSINYISIPDVWNGKVLEGIELGGLGFATFHLSVKLNPDFNHKLLAIQVKEMSSAYRLWVNGKLLAENGIVGKNTDQHESAYITQVKTFINDSQQLDIVLQVSNFSHRNGGARNPILLGTEYQIQQSQSIKWAMDLFLFGSLIIMGLYHLGFFFTLKRNTETVYFSLFCFLISIRILFSGVGGRFITYVFPQITGNITYRIEILSIFMALPVFIRFISLIMNIKKLPFTYKFINWLSLLFCLSALFLPVLYASYFVVGFQLILVFIFLLVLQDLYKAMAEGQTGVLYILIGWLLLSATVANDILFANRFIFTADLTPLGLFIFVLCLSFFNSYKFSDAYKKIENLSLELKAYNKKLSEVNEMKDEFLTNTSHELQTPLNGIIGISESLINGVFGKLSKEITENITLIKSSSQRLSNLIGDILDLAKLKRNELKLDLKPIDVKSIIDIVYLFFLVPAKKKNIEFSHDLSEQIAFVIADENRLQQVFYNLIGNAIKFTERGSVSIFAKEKAGFLEIHIKDTGIGIPEEKFETIFQTYEQVDSQIARTYGGTGLGLSITKHLVSLHNGLITVHSKVGEGSEFIVSIPIAQDFSQEKHSEKYDLTVSETLMHPADDFIVGVHPLQLENQNSIIRNILIIDDEPINLQVVTNHLALKNYNVTTALNGADALDLIMSGNIPDLILLDIMMPGLNGFDMCEKIRSDYSPSELPIIILSVKNNVIDLVKAFKLGANDFLTKPFSAEELIVRVKNQLLLKEAYEMLSENTNLKNELESRRQTELELRRIQYKLSKILDHIEESLLGINENMEISFCNKQFSKLIGQSTTALLGCSFENLFQKEGLNAVNELLNNTLIQGNDLNEYQCNQLNFVHNDGSVFTKNVAWTIIDFEEEKMMMLIASEFPALINDDDISLSDLYDQNESLKKLDAELIKAQLKESSQWDLSSIILDDHMELSERQKVADILISESNQNFAKEEKSKTIRLLLVEIMNLTIDYWVMETKTSKIDLARNSGIWKVYTNRDGWERTQTMDKYLETATLPANPRQKLVTQTAEFVLANCEENTNYRENLELSLMRLKSIL